MVTLKIENMEFSYPGVPVLKDISLEILPGEIMAIVGRNGAGKSTLIKCMNRILEPEKGKIYLGKSELKNMKKNDIARSMAYLSQKAAFAFPVTVFDVVLSGRYPHRSWNSGSKDQAKVDEVLKILELEDLAMRHFNELSGGQQQQVLIARAIVQEASIFLFDEPTSDLDIKHQLEVMETVKRIVREKNVSFVMTIHDLNLALRYADRVLMLKNGTIFAAGKTDSVLTEENISKVYDVHVLINKMEDGQHIIPVRALDNKR